MSAIFPSFIHLWRSMSMPRWIVALVLFCISAMTASGQIRDGGIDPKNVGRGTWIFILPNAVAGLGGNVPAVTNLSSMMFYMKNQGLQYVILKAAQADAVFTVGGNPQFTPEVVAAGHAAGLKVFGYIYTEGGNVPGEVLMADYIFQQGADGLIYDAEGEWEATTAGSQVGNNGPALAIQLCSTVRSNWPNKFMGLSTWPYRAVHSTLPYKEFAYYCDVIMPQAYWIELDDTPLECVTRMNNEWNSWKNGLTGIWTNAIKPFIVSGQGWNSTIPITPQQITEFEHALRTNSNPVSPGGFKMVDYWRAELHPASIWPAIRTNFLARPYTNAPVIEFTPAVTVSATTAKIAWPTDQVSDGAVEYGLTTGYGNATTNATLEWYHAVNLSGLSPNTTYHFRVKSKGTNNLTGFSADFVFTTTAVAVPDITIDQDPANNSGGSDFAIISGSWVGNTAGSAYLGTFRYASCSFVLGSPDRTARFVPSITTAGNYDVYASWAASSAGGNRGTNVPYRIFNGTTTTTTRVSQEANGNTFIRIGTNVFFPAGTSSYVELGNDVTASAGGDIAVADAVRFVYVPPPPSKPSISTQPQNLTINQGNEAIFTVVAGGTAPLWYQWKRAGTNLPGATMSSYSKLNAQPADAGTYSVTITNSVGSTNSANVTLTVNVPPNITSHPQSTNVNVGVNVLFTVSATGSPAPTYQWRFHGTNIASATTTSYARNNVQPADAGPYSVAVSNVAAVVISDDAVLTIPQAGPPPTIDWITMLPDGRAQLQVSGGPGNLAIEQSPALTGWTQAFVTNVVGATFQYTDSETNQAARFYRAARLP